MRSVLRSDHVQEESEEADGLLLARSSRKLCLKSMDKEGKRALREDRKVKKEGQDWDRNR